MGVLCVVGVVVRFSLVGVLRAEGRSMAVPRGLAL